MQTLQSCKLMQIIIDALKAFELWNKNCDESHSDTHLTQKSREKQFITFSILSMLQSRNKRRESMSRKRYNVIINLKLPAVIKVLIQKHQAFE